MTNSNLDPRVLAYLSQVECGSPPACQEQHALAGLVRKCFETQDIYTDSAQLDNYLRLVRYFPFERLFPWEEFLFALWNCTYWRKSHLPRWKVVFCMVGRGAGKDGYLGFDGACSISPYNPVRNYNVDVCANNEEQAMRPIQDFVDVLETPHWETKLNRHYYHTKEIVQGRKNKGTFKGHTNNPKGRDGLRPGKVVFNETHQYENYDNIKVFVSAAGKVAQARFGYFTSNGDVCDGPLDDHLARSMRILFEGEDDKGFLPFICRLNDPAQVHDKTLWAMANPSLPYLPHLMTEIEDEYIDWCDHPEGNGDFMTKRMGIRSGVKEISVTDYDNVKATNQPLPDLQGCSCIAGIDYAELSDFAAVNLHFKIGETRVDINHAWLCLHSRDLSRLKVPWQQWAKDGKITLVDDVRIHPDLLADYLRTASRQYNIKKLAIDGFRYTLVSESLKKIGFDGADKSRVKLVRPSDIMQVVPVITDCFDRQLFVWGDATPLRWAVNNTKRVRSSKKIGCDTGNFIYAKIEAKSRKTDPFMALAASMTEESLLNENRVKVPPVAAIAL